jgi:hypothetical protein
MYLSGEKAAEFLKEITNAGFLDEEMTKLAQNTLAKVTQSPAGDPCLR